MLSISLTQKVSLFQPDLVVTDANGKEKERIDLNGKTGPQVERLLREKGFKKGATL